MKKIGSLKELIVYLVEADKLFKKNAIDLKKMSSDTIYNNLLERNTNFFQGINSKEELLIEDVNFSDADYKELLNQFNSIKFKSCIFENCFSDNLISSGGKKLTFEKCKIKGSFRHIFCASITFENSQIKEYYYENLSENKIGLSNLLFFNSKIDNLKLEGVILNNQIIKNNNNINKTYKKINSLKLKNCLIIKNFIIDSAERKKENKTKRFKIIKLDLTHSIFEENSKVKIQFCDIDEAIFYNTKFKDLADFYQSTFKKVNFERTDFEKISVFSESEFNCDLDFKYTKFLGKAIFRDTVITGELDLRNSIFDDEANFLDITSKSRKRYDESEDYILVGEPTDINVANRETARIIKNFYDNANNIIEANRFYKLEMNKRMKEFNSLKKSDYRLFEKFIFVLHKFSSNHSQSWFISLFWIISLTFAYSWFINDIKYKSSFIYNEFLSQYFGKIFLLISMPIFLSMLIYWLMKKEEQLLYSFLFFLLMCFYITYSYFTHDANLYYFSNSINPFSIMIGNEKLTFLGLIYKTTIAYLIYQLIISIRQNTRRK